VQRRFRSQGVCLLFIAATLAAAEDLVAVWSAFHPAATVHVWRLPAVFDAEPVLAAEPPSSTQPGSAKLSLAEAFVDALATSGRCRWLRQ
jgi:hypothetical protein